MQDVKDGETVWWGRGLWDISVLYDLWTNVFSHFSLKRQHVCPQLLIRVWLFVTPWSLAPLSLGVSRQACWSRLPLPPPGDLPNPGIEPESPVSPALAGRFFTSETPGNSNYMLYIPIKSTTCLKIHICSFIQEYSLMPSTVVGFRDSIGQSPT